MGIKSNSAAAALSSLWLRQPPYILTGACSVHYSYKFAKAPIAGGHISGTMTADAAPHLGRYGAFRRPMIKQELERLISDAVRKGQDAGDLPSLAVPDVPLERPHGPGPR